MASDLTTAMAPGVEAKAEKHMGCPNRETFSRVLPAEKVDVAGRKSLGVDHLICFYIVWSTEMDVFWFTFQGIFTTALFQRIHTSQPPRAINTSAFFRVVLALHEHCIVMVLLLMVESGFEGTGM